MRAHLAERAPDLVVEETEASSATVALAALAFGVTPAEIAKTLSLRVGERTLLLVARGDARLDIRKAKAVFGGKVRMLSADEALAATGHPVGGICPFGLATPLPVYCDVSLRTFPVVVPAAGSSNSAVRVAPARLAEIVGGAWVDVCEIPATPA